MAQQWQVTGQRQTNQLGPDGRWTEVMEITFRVTSTNLTGVIDVPLFEYSADTVQARIDARVTAMLEVQQL